MSFWRDRFSIPKPPEPPREVSAEEISRVFTIHHASQFHYTITDKLFTAIDELLEPEKPYLAGFEGRFEEVIWKWLNILHKPLPSFLKQTPDEFARWAYDEHLGDYLPTAHLCDLIDDLPNVLEHFLFWFEDEQQLFAKLRQQLLENRRRIQAIEHSSRPISPPQFKGTPEELVYAYLRQTPFLQVLNVRVPLELPLETRKRGHWIVGWTGSGKTTLLRSMIFNDILRAADGECSVILIDSQKQIIPEIAALKFFAKGQPAEGRLVHLDPRDVDFPLALGLFDLNTKSASRLQQVQFKTAARTLLEFVLSSLVDQELSGQMQTLLRFVIVLCMEIEDATLLTMYDLLKHKKGEPWSKPVAKAIAQLDYIAQEFFREDYHQPQFISSRTALQRRLYGLLGNDLFKEMFAHPRTKLKLRDEMAKGKVILVDTAKDTFRDEGTELLGRFFIALIGLVAEQRESNGELPCYLYIDEAGDYLYKKSNVESILDQARKKNISVIIAHQRLNQIHPSTKDALASASAIIYASVHDADAHAMAREMKAKPEQIAKKEQPGEFGVFIHGITHQCIDLKFPDTNFGRFPQMKAAEFAAMRQEMRESYSFEARAKSEPPPNPKPPSAEPPPDATPDY